MFALLLTFLLLNSVVFYAHHVIATIRRHFRLLSRVIGLKAFDVQWRYRLGVITIISICGAVRIRGECCSFVRRIAFFRLPLVAAFLAHFAVN